MLWTHARRAPRFRMPLDALAPCLCRPSSQAAWYLKCRALISKSWLDDTEFDEEVRGHRHGPQEAGLTAAATRLPMLH